MPYFIVPSPAEPSCPTLSLRNLPTFRSALFCLALCCRTCSRRAFSRCLFSDKLSVLSGSSLTHLALSSRDLPPLSPCLLLQHTLPLRPLWLRYAALSLGVLTFHVLFCCSLSRHVLSRPVLSLCVFYPLTFSRGDLTLSPALPSPFTPSLTEPSPAKAYCPLPPCHLPPYPLLLPSPAVPCPAESCPEELCPTMPSPAET